MRKTIALFLGFGAICLLNAQTAASPEQLLQRGREEYGAQRYADAANDLRAAADAILSPDQMKNYVNTGQFSSLANFETALVYLTLADVKLGREADAKQQLQRLSVAEGIAPTYATLPLTSEVAEFPGVAQRLMPSLRLPANPTLASAAPPPPPAPVPPPVPAPVQTATATAPAPAPPQQEAVSEAQQRYIDQKIAEARAEIERRAQEQIEAIQKSANEQIAAARAEAAQPQRAMAPAVNTTDAVAALHTAAVQANTGQTSAANDVYLRLSTAPGATRDVIAAAAVGLYRTGDFSDALQAFEKLGTLARGEEDLRYYKAVSLFETGHYKSAKKELDCALPYIQITDDVARYEAKIDEMAATTHGPAGSSS